MVCFLHIMRPAITEGFLSIIQTKWQIINILNIY